MPLRAFSKKVPTPVTISYYMYMYYVAITSILLTAQVNMHLQNVKA